MLRTIRRSVILLATLHSALAHAQQRTDVIVGRVADDSTGLPLRNAQVSVYLGAAATTGTPPYATRSDSLGRFAATITGTAGDYNVSVSLAGYATIQRRVARTDSSARDTIVIDVRLKRTAVQLPAVRSQTSRRQKPPIQDAASSSGTGATDQALMLTIDPTTKGDLALGAASVPGIVLVPDANGGPPSFSVFGLAPSQNSLTLNGLTYGGAVVPSTAYVSSRVVTTASDPTVGGFSGALVATSLSPGGRYSQGNGAITLDAPSLQVTDAAGRALGQQYTNAQGSVGWSGPLWRDKVFYNGALQFAQRTSDAATLVSADSGALARVGASPASVTRFLAALDSIHAPVDRAALTAHDDIVTRSGALLGRFDFSPTPSRVLDVTANANWRQTTPTLLSVAAVPSHAGTITTSTGGVTGEYARFIQDFYLMRVRVGATATVNDASARAALPEGRVLTTSSLDNGPGVATLLFGGASGLPQRTTAVTLESTWETSWFVPSNTHRPKIAAGLRGDLYENADATNTVGVFSYNSVNDLTASRPSSFARTISGGDWRASELNPWMGATDLWRVTDRLALQFGARVEGTYFPKHPDENDAIANAFGVRTDRLPQSNAVLPRLGFNWQYGHNRAKAALGPTGAPTGLIRGTLGAYRSPLPVTALGTVLAGTGLPSSLERITCVGPATPIPDWSAYAASASNIPTSCSGGGSRFTDTRPTATVFTPSFDAPKSWRATLGTSRAFVWLTRIAIDGLYSLSPTQQSTRDLNFSGVLRSTLPAEGGRPLFADPSAIDPRTGAIDPLASRTLSNFSRVTAIASDGRSETKQVTVALTPGATLSVSNYFSLSYTYMRSRDFTNGFDATTSDDPRARAWSTGSGDIRHSINAYATWAIGDESFFTLTSQLRSGAPFTPVVQGDINGDGYSNDRAFVYNGTATADTATARGMSDLLRSAPSNVRDCLVGQAGRAAARNSCRGPWTAALWASASTALSEFHLPTRARVNFTFSNPLALVDQVLHGDTGLRGWGQPALPNPTLLTVTGFDPATRSFKYVVNPLFGDTRPARSALRAPFALTIQITSTLGPPMQRQILDEVLRPGRSKAGTMLTAAQIKARYAVAGIFDPVPPIMAARDSLLLTREQSARLQSIARTYASATDSSWTALAAELASTPKDYDADAMMDRVKVARARTFDALERAAASIREILTPEQFRLLAPEVQQLLDERALHRLRHLQGV